MPHSDALAVYLPNGQVVPPENPYGRLIANAGTYRALAASGRYQHLHIQSLVPREPDEIAAELGVGSTQLDVTTGTLLGTRDAARAGTLLSGQPYLAEPAWIRRNAERDRSYSIVGTIFAYASATHREQMMQAMLAPLQPWDALVCSSPSLRQTVEGVFERWEDYLCHRLSAGDGVPAASPATSGIRLPRPNLPVIGFGSDVDRLAAVSSDAGARDGMRQRLGIDPDDVMVYSLGRLSYYDKAFPQAMVKAVEAARRATGVRTHLVLTGWFPEGDRDRARYEEVARTYAPDLPVTFLDGNDPSVVDRCWAAADIFVLLSDTILETFGQAVVEAMAAGIPVVVSDWDGYRWIVRHGEDGFLVPTLGGPPGPLGESLALLQATGAIGYAQYAGAVAQHTAVSVDAAASALTQLFESPDLRGRMGAAGQRNARERFAWSVVAEQYADLFEHLASLRSSSAQGAEQQSGGHRNNPLRSDPFADFEALPTELLADDTPLRLAPGSPAFGETGFVARTELDAMFPGLRGNPTETTAVLSLLADGGLLTLGEVLGHFPPPRRAFVRMSVMWLAKGGLIEWQTPGPN